MTKFGTMAEVFSLKVERFDRQLSNPPIITEDPMKCWILSTVPQEVTGRNM
jgi:hypothetical protein